MATATGKRRTWSLPKKKVVLREVEESLANDGTIQEVLNKHHISHGMYKRWREEIPPEEVFKNGTKQQLLAAPSPSSASAPPKVITLHDTLEYLRMKRDVFNEIIAELERLEKI